MAFSNYSTADGLFVVNATNITEWGKTSPALKIRDLKPRTSIGHGIGGGGYATDRVAIPKEVTMNLLAGSAQARFMVGLLKSRATIQAGYAQMGSTETEGFINGRIISRGDRDRITDNAESISDEQFVIEFIDSTET